MTANYLHSGNSQLTAHIWVNDLLTEERDEQYQRKTQTQSVTSSQRMRWFYSTVHD